MNDLVQLGCDIVARIKEGDEAKAQAKSAKNQATERFKAAGLLLIRAKAQAPDFKAFLRDHCDGLSRSRAYELIKIAGGKIDEVRADAAERQRKHRVRDKANVTDTDTAPTPSRPGATGTVVIPIEEIKAAHAAAEAVEDDIPPFLDRRPETGAAGDAGFRTTCTTSETAEPSAEARKAFYARTEAEESSTAKKAPASVQADAVTDNSTAGTPFEMASETSTALTPANAVAEVKLAIDRWFPEMDDAGRREIAAYVAARSLDRIPEYLKRAA
jgi:hypothetical protein